jgi:hypothetical protein
MSMDYDYSALKYGIDLHPEMLFVQVPRYRAL